MTCRRVPAADGINTLMLKRLLDTINESYTLMERDVLNAGELKKWVRSTSDRVATPQAKQWIQSQLFQFLINRYTDPRGVQRISQPSEDHPEWLQQKLQSGAEVYQVQPTQELNANIGEVADWINMWVQENPNSRIPFSWEVASQEAERWHKELSRMTAQDNPDDEAEGTDVVYEHDDGFYWVMISSPTCLSREGSRMGHCVGSYSAQVTSGRTRIFSLRNPQNHPAVTIEVNNPYEGYQFVNPSAKQTDLFAGGNDEGTVSQIKGKQNRAPVQKYVPHVIEFLRAFGFEKFDSDGRHDLKEMGYYFKNGDIVGLEDVATTLKTYKNGFRWVFMSKDNTDDRWAPALEYSLVDKNWHIQAQGVSGSTAASDGEISRFNIREGVELEQVTEYIIDLVNNHSVIRYAGGPSDLWSQMKLAIYDGKIGTPQEVAKNLGQLGPYQAYLSKNTDVSVFASSPYNLILLFSGDQKIGHVSLDNDEVKDIQIPYGEVSIRDTIDFLVKNGIKKMSSSITGKLDPLVWVSNESIPVSEIQKMDDLDHIMDIGGELSWYGIPKHDRVLVLMNERKDVLGSVLSTGHYSDPQGIDSFEEHQLLPSQIPVFAYALFHLMGEFSISYPFGFDEDMLEYGWAVDEQRNTAYRTDDSIPVRVTIIRYDGDGNETVMEDDEITIGEYISVNHPASGYEEIELYVTLSYPDSEFEHRLDVDYEDAGGEYVNGEEVHSVRLVNRSDVLKREWDVISLEDVLRKN